MLALPVADAVATREQGLPQGAALNREILKATVRGDVPPVIPEADLDAVRKAREVFALDSSVAAVEPLLRDGAGWQRGQGIGFPITEAEAEVLSARFEVNAATETVIEEARRFFGSSFAGGWLKFNEGKIHIAWATDNPSASVNPLDFASVPADWIVVSTADRSESELQDLSDRIDSDVRRAEPTLVQRGVVAVGVDVAQNSVLVLLESLETADDTTALLAETCGATPDDFSAELYVPPPIDAEQSALFGGHRLGSDESHCSVGPWGWKLWIGFFMSTASHCVPTTYYHWRPTGPGYALSADVFHEPPYDLVAETSLSRNPVPADAAIYARRGGGSEHTRLVEGWAALDPSDLTLTGTANPAQGTIVCHAGSKTRGVGNCGPVSNPAIYPCPGFSDMRGVSYSSDHGDSGAVVYKFVWGSLNVPLVGLHRGIGCNGFKLFTYHETARVELELSGWHVS